MNYGFVKVAAAVPQVKVADCFYNIQQIEGIDAKRPKKRGQIIAFPNYRLRLILCMDLFSQEDLSETPRKPCWI